MTLEIKINVIKTIKKKRRIKVNNFAGEKREGKGLKDNKITLNNLQVLQKTIK